MFIEIKISMGNNPYIHTKNLRCVLSRIIINYVYILRAYQYILFRMKVTLLQYVIMRTYHILTYLTYKLTKRDTDGVCVCVRLVYVVLYKSTIHT